MFVLRFFIYNKLLFIKLFSFVSRDSRSQSREDRQIRRCVKCLSSVTYENLHSLIKRFCFQCNLFQNHNVHIFIAIPRKFNYFYDFCKAFLSFTTTTQLSRDRTSDADRNSHLILLPRGARQEEHRLLTLAQPDLQKLFEKIQQFSISEQWQTGRSAKS